MSLHSFHGRLALALALGALVSACVAPAPTIQTGPDAEISFDGLHKVDHSLADSAWARPDFDISKYTKLRTVGSGIEYAPADNPGGTSIERSSGGTYFINDEQRERFEAEVHDVFETELKKIENFEFVTQPGPDVMLVRGAILDVTSLVPQDPMEAATRNRVFLSAVGEATLVLELRDSESGAILARSVDRRAAERPGGVMFKSNRATNRAEIRRLLQLWAKRLREGLDGFVERQAGS